MDGETAQHSVSVTGVVVRPDGRVLVIKRADDGRWVPPGGILERDEAPEQGVVREVLEETGIKVRPLRLVGVYKNMPQAVVSLGFLCEPIGGAEQISDEATVVSWLTIAEATEAAPEARAVRITDAFADGGPFVRVHDGTSLLAG